MFKLTIETDNAAFTDEGARESEQDHDGARNAQLAIILREIATKLANGYTSGVAFDTNGNSVGKFAVT